MSLLFLTNQKKTCFSGKERKGRYRKKNLAKTKGNNRNGYWPRNAWEYAWLSWKTAQNRKAKTTWLRKRTSIIWSAAPRNSSWFRVKEEGASSKTATSWESIGIKE